MLIWPVFGPCHEVAHATTVSLICQQFAGTHLYFWVERGTVGVKCLVQENNTVCPARAQTMTAHSWDKHTNHEATAPPQVHFKNSLK